MSKKRNRVVFTEVSDKSRPRVKHWIDSMGRAVREPTVEEAPYLSKPVPWRGDVRGLLVESPPCPVDGDMWVEEGTHGMKRMHYYFEGATYMIIIGD